jgi:hypothetical protein
MELNSNAQGVRLQVTEEHTNQIQDIAICEVSEAQISESLCALEQHFQFQYIPEADNCELSLSEFIAVEISNAWSEETSLEVA